MPHFKCLACRTRLYSAGRPGDLVGDLCPRCGSLLEPVGELAEIVGFQAIKDRDSAADDRSPSTQHRIAERAEDFFARREAIHAQARLDAERWVDDGGSFGAEAGAEALALPTPNREP